MQIKRPFRQLVSALHGIAIAHPEPYPRRDGELLGGVALSLDNEPESPALAFAHFHDPRDGGDYFLRRSFKKRRIALHLLPVLDRQLVKVGRTNFNFFLMQFLAGDGNDALPAPLPWQGCRVSNRYAPLNGTHKRGAFHRARLKELLHARKTLGDV